MVCTSSLLSVCLLISFPLKGKTENTSNNPIQFKRVKARAFNGDAKNEYADAGSGILVPISVKALYEAPKCDSNYTIADSEGYLLYPARLPQGYVCEQTFTSASNDSLLKFSCMMVILRFYCELESLEIRTENTTFTFCSNSIVPVISGKSIYIKYQRTLFGLHGSYLCMVVAAGKTHNYTAPLTSQSIHCGVTALKNATRTSISSLPRKKQMSVDMDSENSTSPPTLQRLVNMESGPISTRIVGGVNAQVNEYPWMVYLEVDATAGTYACGGTLITDKTVVTAAHCLHEIGVTQVRAFLGIHNLKKKYDDGQMFICTKYVIHPYFDDVQIINDIAVITLPTPVLRSNAVLPACLPSEFLGDMDGLTATASGWGLTQSDGQRSNTLQTVQLSLLSFADCNQVWSQRGVPIKVTQMCAYAPDKDTCSGDSGGPLIVHLENRWVLVGITSYGYECATPIPGVYTRLSKFVRWVKDQINDTTCS